MELWNEKGAHEQADFIEEVRDALEAFESAKDEDPELFAEAYLCLVELHKALGDRKEFTKPADLLRAVLNIVDPEEPA